MIRLRFDLNMFTVTGLPAWSAAPKVGSEDFFAAVRVAGYTGIQDDDAIPAAQVAGLRMTGSARVLAPKAATEIAVRHQALGFDATTVHLGHGLEDAEAASRLIEAVLNASASTGYPLFVENHRATLTQDMRRTLDLIDRFPELRFNADMTNWYTGLEMPYGDFAAKLAALAPFFDRVRFMHGRIGDSACMQVAIDDRVPEPIHIGHFRDMWQRCAAGFLTHAGAGETLIFAPELLPSSLIVDGARVEVNYARHRDDGEEESDRWAQGLRLCAIMRECFDAARAANDPQEELANAGRHH